MKSLPKNPVCTLLWQDAAYTFESRVPEEMPKPHLTAGFIIKSNKAHTFIATNVIYNNESGSITPVDGLVIPEGAILEFRKIGNYHESQKS